MTASKSPIRAVAWLLHNTVAHSFAGILWFITDMGVGAWPAKLADRLHDATVPALTN